MESRHTRAALRLALLVGLLAHQAQLGSAWWFQQQEAPLAAGSPAKAQAEGAAAAAAARKAVATFDLDGVTGTVTFSQPRPGEPTKMEYDLRGLKGNNKYYHVHMRPVPEFDANKVRHNQTAIAQLCADPATGGHLNPHQITAKLPPKSAPFDKYETGDLSGKHGSMQQLGGGEIDHYKGSFLDDQLPMSGEHSIVGRSVVIHKNDGKRWVCASIVESKS